MSGGTSAMHDLNLHLIDWDKKLLEQQKVNVDAALADADYRHERAVFMAKLKAKDPKLAESWAGVMADADPEVHQKNRARMGFAAVADAVKSRLAWFRAKADALRSEVANDRAASQLYASNGQP